MSPIHTTAETAPAAATTSETLEVQLVTTAQTFSGESYDCVCVRKKERGNFKQQAEGREFVQLSTAFSTV
jgi:hypothetical protein